MATYKIYKLHFTAPLHIGDQHEEEGISLKTIHSDTIYAALMSCLAKTGFEIPADAANSSFQLASSPLSLEVAQPNPPITTALYNLSDLYPQIQFVRFTITSVWR